MRYSPVPNEVYHICLSAGAIAVYGYLLYIENCQTYKSYASDETIGKVVDLRPNTVRKYVAQLSRRCTPQEPHTVGEQSTSPAS